jgi:hypothetical protein
VEIMYASVSVSITMIYDFASSNYLNKTNPLQALLFLMLLPFSKFSIYYIPRLPEV